MCSSNEMYSLLFPSASVHYSVPLLMQHTHPISLENWEESLLHPANPSNPISPSINNCQYAIYSIIIDPTIPVCCVTVFLSSPIFGILCKSCKKSFFNKVSKPDAAYDHYIKRSLIRYCG
jgi:hypothetical protein